MRLNARGQFIPITAMVMFTTMVFLVAVVNIYKVSRAKLKVQNLADAAALNVASQIVSSLNKVADMNEWMNHLVAQAPNAPPTKPGTVPNCIGIDPDWPPLSCAENATGKPPLNMFTLKGDAANYAALVQTINKAQQLFVDAYNNFIGAGVGSNSSISTKSSLQSILFTDIRELTEPGTYVAVWNTQPPAGQTPSGANVKPSKVLDTTGMQPLKFQIHDVAVTFKNPNQFGIFTPPPSVMTLGQLLAGKNKPVTPVGWMIPDPNQPSINIGPSNSGKLRVGAGARVSRYVRVPILGNILISAQAQAYVVEGSGIIGTPSEMVSDPAANVQRPVFKPTYWIKLAGK